ncbi:MULTISPECIES: lipopolysaccharide assembly LapA domain-containing protein [unclassified Corynebacterium]|uniref:LapA family protein n=1 Tax=unclassified Corynebacterium TaxID=2624378 RepID=UPI00352411D6
MTRNTEASDADSTELTSDAPTPVTGYPANDVPATQNTKARTVAGSTWVALIIGALLLILLLVFIMQNQQHVDLTLFAWEFSVPAGVGVLLAVITGALIMALVGGMRMLELRRELKKYR